MGGFLYWVPAETTGAAAVVAGAGLAYVFGPAAAPACGCRAGPDGQAGVVLADRAYDGRVGYYPGDQTWAEAGGRWLGWPADAPPGPEDLARPDPVPGHVVTLGDGRAWTVPLVRVFPRGTRLPQKLVLGPDGAWMGEVPPEYLGLCQAVGEAWDAFFAADAGPDEADGALAADPERLGRRLHGRAVSLPDAADLAVRGLALNYRISAAECSVLGLFDSRTLGRAIGALFDLPAVLAAAEDLAAAAGAEKKDAGPPTA